MHLGAIKDRSTAAGRVYAVLRDRPGMEVRGPVLAKKAAAGNEPLDAVSTRVSEVRKQLPPGEVIPPAIRKGNSFYYVLILTGDWRLPGM